MFCWKLKVKYANVPSIFEKHIENEDYDGNRIRSLT